MQNYLWIVLVVFVMAIVAYIRSTKPKEEEPEGDERYLIGMGGPYRGQVFPIGREVVIGRDAAKCGIIFPKETRGVSSAHCKVKNEAGKVVLVDLSSTYGTFRDNGEKLQPNMAYYLEAGDGFYVGDAENTFLVK